ncbi:hypothetical protein OO007_06470 [Cocleimonas sp. KMM 6892]|uniref:hypothetical protein n=1 Tax=unclassified Cocleimonas TaxID=2639732 RepID=UPI002DBBD661|nr:MULTISPECIES: hypothetical protein [unclassified Cocleimonas]MEB8431866.1 hypothetical protein [Cocleimonas sp. KMM 6892]MEC4715048.1 hypothetical protein [Cocleimonas sp. KMM 6895]MEC4744138.1 hypothetical protein [Cocleimonas sp. KMM 6896]
MSNNFDPCVIEKSPINGNFTLWLPEQEGIVEWLEQKHQHSQGHIWHGVICAFYETRQLSLSDYYIEPEGDVFVAYTKTESIANSMATVILELLEKKSLMLEMADYAEKHGYY